MWYKFVLEFKNKFKNNIYLPTDKKSHLPVNHNYAETNIHRMEALINFTPTSIQLKIDLKKAEAIHINVLKYFISKAIEVRYKEQQKILAPHALLCFLVHVHKFSYPSFHLRLVELSESLAVIL